jgi:hypothetical protein
MSNDELLPVEFDYIAQTAARATVALISGLILGATMSFLLQAFFTSGS